VNFSSLCHSERPPLGLTACVCVHFSRSLAYIVTQYDWHHNVVCPSVTLPIVAFRVGVEG